MNRVSARGSRSRLVGWLGGLVMVVAAVHAVLHLGEVSPAGWGTAMTAFLIHNMAPIMFFGLVVFLIIGYPAAFAGATLDDLATALERA